MRPTPVLYNFCTTSHHDSLHDILALPPRFPSISWYPLLSFTCNTKLCNKWNSAIWYNSNKSAHFGTTAIDHITNYWPQTFHLKPVYSPSVVWDRYIDLSDKHFRLVSGISSRLNNLKLTILTKDWTKSACPKNLRNELHMNRKMFVLLPDKCENATPS